MKTRNSSPAEPIAVVGSACRFPGESTSPSKLWSLLSSPRDVISDLTSPRFDPKGFHHAGDHHGALNVSQSYLLSEDPREFDASFFSINAREADTMDPQQRILLETVYEGLESAGMTIKEMQGSQTAVYVGLMSADYGDIQLSDVETMPRYTATGIGRSIMSNRISYFYDWKGPSMTIDTACSSSLVAVHQAVEILRSGRVDMAVAAGANSILSPEVYISETRLNMLSPSGRSRMWDSQVDGYGRGEGFAAVILKTLSKAIADGDHIECIIRETGINQDGRTTGITMPSSISQAQLIRETYARAGLDCSTEEGRCQYFEAHGTGTPAGDPIEAKAIASAFFDHGKEEKNVAQRDDVLYVGSIKTIIGHTEGTAGLAGFLKASLALQHQIIPPNMHLQELNPKVTPFTQHLIVPTTQIAWPAVPGGGPRRASLNSFGFGGTNAHAILESYENPEHRPTNKNLLFADQSRGLAPFVFSANTDKSLAAKVQSYVDFLESTPNIDVLDLAWNLLSRREVFPYRKAFSGTNIEELQSAMKSALKILEDSPEASFGTHVGRSSSESAKRVLGVFTGQGAQWPRMGAELLKSSQVFLESINGMEEALAVLPIDDAPKWSLKAQLEASMETSCISEAALSQPLCTAVQVALVDVLRTSGVSFHTVVGHSSGEIAATYAAGIITAADAIRIAYYRGLHSVLAAGGQGQEGKMLAVGLSFAEGQEICSRPQFAGRVATAASNAPSSVTLSGDADAILEIKALLDAEKTFARLLQVDKAYHSHHMTPCVSQYLQSLRACNIRPQAPTLAVWQSSVFVGQEFNLDSLADTYWTDNLTKPVLLSQALEHAYLDLDTASSSPFDISLEIGPHSALKGPVSQTIQSLKGTAIPYQSFLRRGTVDTVSFSAGLGFLWEHSKPESLHLDSFTRSLMHAAQPNRKPRVLKNLPAYSWDHSQLYWRESRISKNFRNRTAPIHELLGVRSHHDIDAHELRWRNILKLDEIPWLQGHCFQGQALFPAAGYVVLALEAAKTLANGRDIKLIELEDLDIFKAITIEQDGPGTEVIFSLNLIQCTGSATDSTSSHADFACYSCNDEKKGNLDKCARGRVHVIYGPPSEDTLPSRSAEHDIASKVDVSTDKFYASMVDIGLDYTGIFQTLENIGRRNQRASASTIKTTHPGWILHPALLDICFQSMIAALCFPGDGTLWSPYLPTQIRRLRVNPMLCERPGSTLELVSAITEDSSKVITGDVEAFGPDGKLEIQLEGLSCSSFSKPTSETDRLLFSETCLDVDILTGLSADLEIYQPDPQSEIDIVDACERAAYYYLRTLREKFSSEETVDFEWFFQRLFEYADYLLPLAAAGKLPNLNKEWALDTEKEIKAIEDVYCDQIDMRLIKAVGQALPTYVTGTAPLLSVMLEDGMLGKFYQEGVGAPQANAIVARIVKQIVHRYPNIKILEIGAGTGGTTKGVLAALESKCSYTFTDISTGFFEMAKEGLGDLANDQVVFKALDIERDPATQGFADGTYDIIIAANVLHATKTLSATMANVRKLMRPGGFLVLNEVTGILLRTPLIMSGLSGWWLGADDGRRYGPTISEDRWDVVLKEAGFSGIDQTKHDLNDPHKQTSSIMVSQAVDEMIEFVRDPIENSFMAPYVDDLFVIGGNSVETAKFLNGVRQYLDEWNDQAIYFKTLDSFDADAIPNGATILCMVELDQPILKQLSSQELKCLGNIFSRAKNVLWVNSTSTVDGAYAMATLGLARTALMECPQLNLQVLDVQDYPDTDISLVVGALLRLVADESLDSTYLWTKEPELIQDGKKFKIPRLLPNNILNNQLNATRRYISQRVLAKDQPIELLFASNGQPTLQKAKLRSIPTAFKRNILSVDVKFSLPFSLNFGSDSYFFICLGTVSSTGEQVIAISESNESVINVAEDWVFKCNLKTFNREPEFLRLAAEHILAQALLSGLHSSDAILLHNPEDQLAAIIIQQGSELGVRVYTTSSDKRISRDIKTTILVHELDSVRKIKSHLPPGLKRFINCSAMIESPAIGTVAQITASLPNSCNVQTLAESFGYTTTVNHNTPAQEISNILVNACRNSYVLLGQLQAVETISLAIEDISSITKAKGQTSVIDWKAKEQVEVRVAPIRTNGLFSPEKTYILFGLSGDLGRSLAEWMVICGAKYLVLTSRQPAIEDSWIKEMSKDGAVIKVMANDITNKQSVKDLRDEIARTMPQVGGVANGAMVLIDQLFENMDLKTWETVVKPKIDGSLYLDELFPAEDLEFFVMCSSAASTVGNAGQSNYSAGCMFMAGLAEDRRKRGLAASVMQIGLVVGVGYVARIETGVPSLLAHKFNPISEPLFHEMFADSIICGRPDSGFQTLMTTGLQRSNLAALWADNPRFSHMIQHESSSGNVTHETIAVIPPRIKLESTTSLEDAVSVLVDCFRTKLAIVLQAAFENIHTSVPLIDLGIDSLIAVDIRTWFLKEVNADVPVLKVLGGESIAEICREVIGKSTLHMPWNTTAEVSAESEHSILGSTENGTNIGSTAITTPASDITGILTRQKIFDACLRRLGTMSHPQARIFLASSILDDPTTYNVAFAWTISGEIESAKLDKSLQAVAQRHESLRTAYYADETTGQPTQRVLEASKLRLELKYVLNDDAKLEEFEELRSYEFDIEEGDTIRAMIVSTPTTSTLMICYHHIIMDQVSLSIVLKDIAQAYTLGAASLGPARQYLDFAIAQQQSIDKGDLQPDIDFWKAQYPEPPPSLPLFPFALVKSRQVTLTTYDAFTLGAYLHEDLSATIKSASVELRSTPFHFYTAVLQILLFQTLHGKTIDLSLGIADGNRLDTTYVDTVGFFVNMLPVRASLSKTDTFRNTITKARTGIYSGLSHSSVPFDVLINSLAFPRNASSSENPLFQVLFSYTPLQQVSKLGDAQISLVQASDARGSWDLNISVTEAAGEKTAFTFSALRYLYREEDIKGMMDRYVELLTQFSRNPNALIGL